MGNNAAGRLARRVRKDGFHIFYLGLYGVWTKVANRSLSTSRAVHVMDEPWDHLILLDACRHDLFCRAVGKDVPFRISGGSATQEWLSFNFKARHDDVVCIAGNPHLSSVNLKKTFGRVPFFGVVEVWDFGWDGSVRTVPPSAVTDAAVSALKRYPGKRLYVHYNQPHHPFLGDPELLEGDDGTGHSLEGGVDYGTKTTVWDRARKGEVSKVRVERAYLDNLKMVLDETERLLDHLEGRVLITSDHGNHMGERGVWGHYPHIRSEPLVKVPWHFETGRGGGQIGRKGDGETAAAREVAGRGRF